MSEDWKRDAVNFMKDYVENPVKFVERWSPEDVKKLIIKFEQDLKESESRSQYEKCLKNR